jgi:hypothetical protein
MHLPPRVITHIFLAIALLPIPKFVAAQEGKAATGVPVQIVVTAEPKHGNGVQEITQQDVIVNQGHDRRPVTGWVPAAGPHAGLELAILIDDAAGFNFGSQMDDIRVFITEQPPTTLVAVGDMQNGTVSLAQNFTQDPQACGK